MTDVTNDVIAIIAKKVRVENHPKIELSDRLEDLGLESLDAVEMIFDLEEKFDIQIPYNANTNNPRTEFDDRRRRRQRDPKAGRQEEIVSDVNRVVVTGLGAVTPLGQTVPAYWDALKRGTSGMGPITLTSTPEELTQKVVAEIKNFEPLEHFEERELSTLDRVSQIAVVAAREAIAHSAITFDMPLSLRTACIIGSGVGGMMTLDDTYRRVYLEKKKRVFPLSIPRLMINAPASQISMHCGLRGPAYVIASACASATHAIGAAFHMVRSGAVDCAVTGGSEACISFGTMRGWEAMRVMAPEVCRPFSIGREGMMIGEGAAVLVLEPLERAQARGAKILCEIVGFGMSADAADLTAPDVGGMARAMQGALDDAGMAAQRHPIRQRARHRHRRQ